MLGPASHDAHSERDQLPNDGQAAEGSTATDLV